MNGYLNVPIGDSSPTKPKRFWKGSSRQFSDRNPRIDYSSSNCPKREGIWCKSINRECNESFYNNCPIFKGNKKISSY